MDAELLERLITALYFRKMELIAPHLTGDFGKDLIICLELITGRKWYGYDQKDIIFDKEEVTWL